MKKWLALVLVLILIPSFAFAIDFSHYIDENGNFFTLYTSEDGNSYKISPSSLPCSFGYKDKEVTVVKADLYQAQIASAYHAFYHIRLDASQLTTGEAVRLCEDKLKLSANCSPNLFSNDFIYFSVALNTCWLDTKEIDIVFYTDGILRYPFDGYYISGTLEFEHYQGLDILFETDTVTIDATEIAIDVDKASPLDLSSMDSWTYDQLKQKLSEKGLKLE